MCMQYISVLIRSEYDAKQFEICKILHKYK
jgi:hypothetical protein